MSHEPSKSTTRKSNEGLRTVPIPPEELGDAFDLPASGPIRKFPLDQAVDQGKAIKFSKESHPPQRRTAHVNLAEIFKR